ncbi:ABC transporter ATP-binding protein [Oscillatoria sp. CS-180]|uniref:ABC transporter ATP-binding protein n=1 Tax=Oscillatoria sp. CS-180 TaxID=3021720 RepID=UPI00232EF624|nr:ABC transporter ATP-binding protein [Oscillatoria sp. CS-180]MDB9528345.1 ABC transporter ATP-binding protein [Oscillatoria sp. CS-180]
MRRQTTRWRRSLRERWQSVQNFLDIYRYCGRAIQLVWMTNWRLTLALAAATLVAGLLPGAIAYFGKLIVDAVIEAAETGSIAARNQALTYLGLEAILVVVLAGARQGLNLCTSLLRVLLGQSVNLLILQKAQTLPLVYFEDSEFYDKMSRARREASSRPLSMVSRTFGLIQNTLSLLAYGGLLLQFSGWAVVILMGATVPAFIAETRFAGRAFRLFRWRSPETRQQNYLEVLLGREDYAKEVKLFQLGPMLLRRYQDIFNRVYHEDRDLTVRRGFWSYGLGLLSTAAFYGAYCWIVLAAIARRISLGDLTMYLTVFRQGQNAFSSILTSIGGMYEDGLYLSNLYEFLEQTVPQQMGYARSGISPDDGLRFEQVSFHYPEAERPALADVSFHLKPGKKLAIVGENGSGKTTLIKLLTRLYTPTKGRILLDGRDLAEWDIDVLRERIGVIFQDFVRYQFKVGENIGVGDVHYLEQEDQWAIAAKKGTATPFIETLPNGFQTQLGKWFRGGQELSGGQWQKVALSRAFMRSNADLLVLDEPTSAMDAEAEAKIFDQFRAATENQMAILISHRFSTVRRADEIMVLSRGKAIEYGTHEELMAHGGRYAQLFQMQAAGYQ